MPHISSAHRHLTLGSMARVSNTQDRESDCLLPAGCLVSIGQVFTLVQSSVRRGVRPTEEGVRATVRRGVRRAVKRGG